MKARRQSDNTSWFHPLSFLSFFFSSRLPVLSAKKFLPVRREEEKNTGFFICASAA